MSDHMHEGVTTPVGEDGVFTLALVKSGKQLQVPADKTALQVLEAAGIDVIGPTDHTIFKSIYFFDPNGHRLELAVDIGTPEMYQKLDEVKWAMLNEWSQTKRAPKQAAWLHAGAMAR